MNCRWQFSLRTLLLALTASALCIAAALAVRRVEAIAQLTAAAAEFKIHIGAYPP